MCSTLSTSITCGDYCSLITSYLGPNKRFKFVGEDCRKAMVCCTAEFIRYLNCPCCLCSNGSTLKCNFQHPVNCVVSSCVQSHHSAFGCSSATLLAMFYFWHQGLVKLKNEGVNIGRIILILTELLENVIHFLDSVVIHFHSKVESCFAEMQPEAILGLNKLAIISTVKNPQCSESNAVFSNVPFLKQSRHILNRMNKEEKTKVKASRISFEDLPSFSQLVNSLEHGNFPTKSLITKVWSNQINDRKTTYPHCHEIWRFDISQIKTLTVNSLPSTSKVVRGILLQTCHENVEILSNFQKQNIRTLLINGNVTPRFTHKGVNLPENIKNGTKTHDGHNKGVSKESAWMSETLNVLKKMNVSMILASGKIDQDIVTRFHLCKICAMSNISIEVLNTAANSSGASIASYVTDCDELNVVTSISVSIERTFNIIDRESASTDSYIILHLPSLFQTVVICHPVAEYLSCLEHGFWHVAHRLANATAVDKVLPGRCKTEEAIMNFLHLDSRLDVEFLLAKKIITDGFQDFINVVKAKLCDDHSNEGFEDIARDTVLDDYISKIESWRSALRLACSVSQTDLMIITGDAEKCKEHVNHSNSGFGML